MPRCARSRRSQRRYHPMIDGGILTLAPALQPSSCHPSRMGPARSTYSQHTLRKLLGTTLCDYGATSDQCFFLDPPRSIHAFLRKCSVFRCSATVSRCRHFICILYQAAKQRFPEAGMVAAPRARCGSVGTARRCITLWSEAVPLALTTGFSVQPARRSLRSLGSRDVTSTWCRSCPEPMLLDSLHRADLTYSGFLGLHQRL